MGKALGPEAPMGPMPVRLRVELLEDEVDAMKGQLEALRAEVAALKHSAGRGGSNTPALAPKAALGRVRKAESVKLPRPGVRRPNGPGFNDGDGL